MIRHILFDIDNTLYSCTNPIEMAITQRIHTFVAHFLHVSCEEARALRQRTKHLYATTFEWLKAEHNLIHDEHYFRAVYPPTEIQELQYDPMLRPFLQSLHMPLTALTNAPRVHAQRVLDFFHLSDLFLDVFDITYHAGKGKPHHSCFVRTLEAVHKTVQETLFVDDCLMHVRAFIALGGHAVLVDERDCHAELPPSARMTRVKTIYELPAHLARLAQGDNQ
ncbi:pyrimidine 5'-nucleotidase [Treponema pallidum]|nr:pyrimidine 5'-nucleotidase [Treponema pallidum]AHN66861.1 HAD-superfamily hydrolase [Treponema pallidum subsp. pallidum str. Sea 81-4]ADD72308.1 HAD-superfamily hydrolase, subfamily IA, variant 3 [Treponema pallidum subsp. pallidum str. Chicago]ANA41889.1 HAD-superfamily hydrolase [Treponema pallidum subsp. pallidum]QUJ38333.2 pyrimidine 5'-nucleotidase [Treponema pallidum]QUJ39300.2 pyrimidine 5'-nucleotidase [Treponema pallidum]